MKFIWSEKLGLGKRINRETRNEVGWLELKHGILISLGPRPSNEEVGLDQDLDACLLELETDPSQFQCLAGKSISKVVQHGLDGVHQRQLAGPRNDAAGPWHQIGQRKSHKSHEGAFLVGVHQPRRVGQQRGDDQANGGQLLRLPELLQEGRHLGRSSFDLNVTGPFPESVDQKLCLINHLKNKIINYLVKNRF